MTSRPAFAHPVFEQLYERDYHLADDVLRQILALGPETAVPELLKITAHTLETFNLASVADDGWYRNFHFLHALYLLYALGAPEALDVYRRLLHLDDETVEFWFGDALFEEVPALVARAAERRLPDLLAWLHDTAMPTQHCTVASHALALLARTHPALRPAVAEGLRHYLRRILDHPEQRAALFPPDDRPYAYELDTYLGFVLCDIQDADLRELDPEMRELHHQGLVDESIGGGEDKIKYGRNRPLDPPLDVFVLYQEFRADPDDRSPHNPDAAAIAVRRARQEAAAAQRRREILARPLPPQPRLAPPKTGRNDPCPCGSGQKFKKCHGA